MWNLLCLFTEMKRNRWHTKSQESERAQILPKIRLIPSQLNHLHGLDSANDVQNHEIHH